MEGTVRKVITVRSALMIDNQLGDAVEVQLDNDLVYSYGEYYKK